jgi:hypothetical protein
MSKLSGWQKAGLVAGLGCLSVIVVAVVGVIVAIVWARASIAQLGDTTPTEVERTVGLRRSAGAASDPEKAPPVPGAAAGEPLRLTIDLEEGFFTIRPGAPGEQVQVQGTYAPALYELIDLHETAPDGADRATIRFRSKAPAWARLFSSFGGGPSGARPNLTVLIPEGAPMDLALRVSMGESRIELGGLMLRELDLNVSMGEHRIDFGKPVEGALRRVRLDASMGNVSVDNLGNTRAEAIETTGSMGNLTADLGGAWAPETDAALTFSQSMGELTLRVPSGVRLETDFRNGSGEPSRQPTPSENPSDPKAPLLRLRVNTSMGESRVVRY